MGLYQQAAFVSPWQLAALLFNVSTVHTVASATQLQLNASTNRCRKCMLKTYGAQHCTAWPTSI